MCCQIEASWSVWSEPAKPKIVCGFTPTNYIVIMFGTCLMDELITHVLSTTVLTYKNKTKKCRIVKNYRSIKENFFYVNRWQ